MKKVLLALSTMMCGVASALDLDVSIGAIRHDPSGKIEYKGDRIDVDQDLRLGKETKAYARLRLEHGVRFLPDLYLQYMPVKFTGSNRINRQIRYGNRTFQADTDVYSSIRLDHYDIGLYGNIALLSRISRGVLDPEIGLNVRVIDFEGKIRGIEAGTGQQIEESKSATVPVPMLYGALGINIPKTPVAFRAELRTLPVSEIKYYDIVAELRFRPVKPLYVSAGYHYEKLKIDRISNVFTDIKVRGPYFMIGAEF